MTNRRSRRKAILEAQRHNHTLDGIRRKKQREQVVQRHHAFQRLLKPVAVVNPFEPLLTYAENRLLVRRDNPKYLHLILAVTFLYQLQRPVKHDADAGDYIETTLDDIAIANELATDLFGQSLGELSRPSRELLKLIRRMTEEMERKPGRSANKVGAGTACFQPEANPGVYRVERLPNQNPCQTTGRPGIPPAAQWPTRAMLLVSAGLGRRGTGRRTVRFGADLGGGTAAKGQSSRAVWRTSRAKNRSSRPKNKVGGVK